MCKYSEFYRLHSKIWQKYVTKRCKLAFFLLKTPGTGVDTLEVVGDVALGDDEGVAVVLGQNRLRMAEVQKLFVIHHLLTKKMCENAELPAKRLGN